MKSKHAISALGLFGCLLLAAPASAEDAKPAATTQPSAAATATTDTRQRATEILKQMLPPEIATGMANAKPRSSFGGEMSRLAFENAYMQLWTRPGLSLRDRSLVTISMLIALGNEHELKIHLASGLRNGLTAKELEEVIYQATGYVGFPRASDALAIASEVVAKEQAGK
jgi:4-carboxymuconolactone decarboxylase